MRSNTSLYIGVYIWIASLEILTKILRRIRNYPSCYRFSLGFLFGCRGQRPIPPKSHPKSNELLRIFSKDFSLGLSSQQKIFNKNPN